MSDDYDEDGLPEEIAEAVRNWFVACDAQVDAEIDHQEQPSEETEAALEEASGAVDAAQDYVLDLIRQEKEADSPTPYRGPFRE